MSATIRDVARRAGVSIATVSRALNGSSPVAEEKRRLVEAAAEALGYVPNPAARSLHGKRTGAVGVLLPYVSGEFFAELLNGLDEAARELGLLLVVSTSYRSPADFQRAVRALDRRVDGLVVMAPEIDGDGAASLVRPGTPVVFVNTQAEGLAADVLTFDNAGGVAALVRRLVAARHRRIALVRGPAAAWDAGERARGYRQAMAEAGLEPVEVQGGYSQASGAAAARELLARSPRPTAVVAPNDYAALGVLSALHDAGVDVPGDVSVTGFDGLPSGQFNAPSLATLRVPIREIGARAIELLARRADGDDSDPVREVVPVELVLGDSAGPAPPQG